MHTKNNRFENLIRTKLKDFEADVPDSLWLNIENRLPEKKHVWMRPVFRYAAACAAILIGGIATYTLFFVPENIEHRIAEVRQDEIKREIQIFEPVKTEDNYISPEIEENKVIEKQQNIKEESYTAPTSIQKKILPTTTTKESRHQGNKELLATNKVQEKNKDQNQPITPKKEITDNEKYGYPADMTKEEYNQKMKEFEKIIQNNNSDFAGFNAAKNINNNGISLKLMASNSLPGSKNMANRPFTQNAAEINDGLSLYSDEEQLRFIHKVPLSFGLTVEKQLPRNWSIESGIVYTLLRSDYKTKSLSRKGKQELHYIGIPVNAIYRFARLGNASFYASAGVQADFNVSGKRTEDVENKNLKNKLSEDIRDKRIQWSFNLKAGAAYALHDHIDLYLEPGMAYYLDNSSIPNLWHDRPLNFTVQLGLRTNF
ncbi:porin family protein [Coprobacter tertius]|uniref:PorT family protein n=1 Tax=Coprobacter tertius TaxID=2944915 RepID=A0ABT1MHA9_9BACT|nr:porin family protein [Coprobacter tertius]MCP9612012.1 PorT family protein [Coprobacter tertius]